MAKKNLLIGVGGTGARVLEAFTYLSAAGVLGEQVPEVYMTMVDMDTENGNLLRLEKVKNCLARAYKPLFTNAEGWKARKIITPEGLPFTWQVGTGEGLSLNDKFSSESSENMKLLYGLYGGEDLAMNLTVGCKGRPRIGALEFSKRFMEDCDSGSSSYWQRLFSGQLQAAANNGELQVMLVGSMFGGSGASGVPNLARLISDTFCGHNNRVSITLMAPFYNYVDVDILKEDGAKSKEFMINSKAALLYYSQSGILNELHSQYIVGGSVREMKKADDNIAGTAIGSTDQCNPAMPELVVAALAALDFFSGANEENGQKVVVADTGVSGMSDWRAYPYEQELKAGMSRLQLLTLLWRLVDRALNSADKGAWKALHDKYKPMFGGGEIFDPARFSEYTTDIRMFLSGTQDDEAPQNIGAEGFLRELEKNGMIMLNTQKEAEFFDAASSLDNSERLARACCGVPIVELVDKLQHLSGIKVGESVVDDKERRRLKFIAATAKACIDMIPAANAL